MSQTNQEIVGILVSAFPEEASGEHALKVLKEAKELNYVYFEDAALIRQDADGDVHYHETGDMGTGKGSGIGAIIGGVIGILGGPAGVVAGAGAGSGPGAGPVGHHNPTRCLQPDPGLYPFDRVVRTEHQDLRAGLPAAPGRPSSAARCRRSTGSSRCPASPNSVAPPTDACWCTPQAPEPNNFFLLRDKAKLLGLFPSCPDLVNHIGNAIFVTKMFSEFANLSLELIDFLW